MESDRNILKIEAEGIIRELQLLDLLAQYGEVRVVGSVALDLIVKLDIDIHLLIAAESDLLDVVDHIYHRLLDCQHIREVRITDYREQNAIKIGIDVYLGASGDWSIDIWVTDRPEETAFEYDGSAGTTPDLAQIDPNDYLCAYSGKTGEGYAVVLTVDSSDWTISKGTTFEYESATATAPDLAQIDPNDYLCAFTGGGDDGWSVVLKPEGGQLRP